MDAYVDNLQRQLDEIEALHATYPEDEGCVTFAPEELEALSVVQAAVRRDPPFKMFQLPNISGTVRLPGVMVSQAPVSLRFQLPSGYPSMATPQLLVECTAPRWLHEHLTTAIQLAAEQALGNESLLLLLDQLQEEARRVAGRQQVQPGFSNSVRLTDPATAAEAACSTDRHGGMGGPSAAESAAQHNSDSSRQWDIQQQQQQQPQQQCAHDLLRVVVWFHHIKNTNKRKSIVAWARELGLGGYCKPGFPGVVIAEGGPVDIREYLSRIRGLSWQAMQVRGEQLVQCSKCAADAGGAGVIQPNNIHAEASSSSSQSSTAHELHGQRSSGHGFVEAPRVFNGRFVELAETGGLGELGQFCTAAGIEDLFLKALKIAR